MTVAEALLDQTAVAGIGNVYRSEVLFIERVDPFVLAPLAGGDLLERVLRTAARLLRANVAGGARVTMPDAGGGQPGALSVAPRTGSLWVYGRTGRPCRRCGGRITSQTLGTPPRRLYWCPSCQSSERPTARATSG
jgi:endonuclease-8